MGVIQRLPESVVNRIAAGEVVVRPANAVKELIENCLDAGASEIVVTVKDGGLTLLQVQDNGKGIYKDDLPIVCERFTTSKLRAFEDLQSMSTYGFRGEALSSLSHVATVSITSRPADQKCAYQATYKDSVPSSVPRVSAGQVGTTVSATHLFAECPSRRQAMRQPAEETARIADVLTRYAVHRPDVSFAFRRGGSGADFRTSGKGERRDTIQALIGKAAGESLLDLSLKSSSLHFSLSGCISRPQAAATAKTARDRKGGSCMFVFINGRSVQCAQLRHAVDTVLSSRDVTSRFTLLDIQIAPNRVDVNVHPTKQSVLFLEQDAIIAEVQYYLDSLVASCLGDEMHSRSVQGEKTLTQSLLFPTETQAERMSSQSNLSAIACDREKPVETRRDYKLVRTSCQTRRLDEFFEKDVSQSDVTTEPVSSQSQQDGTCELIVKPNGRVCRVFHLDSLRSLRRRCCEKSSDSLRHMFKSHTFVGCVSASQCLLQWKTALYLVDLNTVAEEMFYQYFVFSFGNCGSFQLGDEGADVAELYLLGQEAKEGDEKEKDGKLAHEVAEFLLSHADMLDDYFSLRIEKGEDSVRLMAVPSVVSGWLPQLEGLPVLIRELVENVDWDEEEQCFSGICRALSRFFAPREEYCDGVWQSGVCASGVKCESGEEAEWTRLTRDVLLPRIRAKLLPPTHWHTGSTIQQLADLHDLYKVFERC